jgi:uncharacterized repeat protein (TIGR02543 family)/LPXTG-motif cell wall-anchored protein
VRDYSNIIAILELFIVLFGDIFMLRKIIAAVLSILLGLIILPAVANASPVYNSNDTMRLKTFLDTENGSTTNGLLVNALYDSADPDSYGVTWTLDGGEYRATEISWFGNYLPDLLTGTLDLSGMDKLVTLSVPYNNITSIVLTGCSAMNTINCRGNHILTKLTVPALSAVDSVNIGQCYDLVSVDLSAISSISLLTANVCKSLKSFKAMNEGKCVFLEAAGDGYLQPTRSGSLLRANAIENGGSFLDWAQADYNRAFDFQYDFYFHTGEAYHITANFASDSYTFFFNSTGGSDVGSQEIAAGSTATMPVDTTRDGYTFTGWYTTEALDQEYDFSSAAIHNHTLYANWTQNPTSTSTPTPTPTPMPAATAALSQSSGTMYITPACLTMYVGGREMLIPSVKGGTWQFDPAFLKIKNNTDGTVTITGLKVGETVVHYTIGWAEKEITVTILERKLPQTGQNFTAMNVLIAMAACAVMSSAVILQLRKKMKLK